MSKNQDIYLFRLSRIVSWMVFFVGKKMAFGYLVEWMLDGSWCQSGSICRMVVDNFTTLAQVDANKSK